MLRRFEHQITYALFTRLWDIASVEALQKQIIEFLAREPSQWHTTGVTRYLAIKHELARRMHVCEPWEIHDTIDHDV
jgi:hypothetical protein